jgi:hypothetical protein
MVSFRTIGALGTAVFVVSILVGQFSQSQAACGTGCKLITCAAISGSPSSLSLKFIVPMCLLDSTFRYDTPDALSCVELSTYTTVYECETSISLCAPVPPWLVQATNCTMAPCNTSPSKPECCPKGPDRKRTQCSGST